MSTDPHTIRTGEHVTTDPWANLLDHLLAAGMLANGRNEALDNIEAVLHAALEDPQVLPVLMQHLNAQHGWRWEGTKGPFNPGRIEEYLPDGTEPPSDVERCWVVVAPTSK